MVARLPHGVLPDGAVCREVRLRAPTGADEAFVAGLDGASAAARGNALLERCVVGLDDVRALVAGDREALLLQLRALVSGDRLACVVTCASCAEQMDVVLSVAALLVAPYDEDVAAEHEIDGVRFRLPTGADLEAAGEASSVEEGTAVLLDRCVGSPGGFDADAVGAEMARLDPQAEVRLGGACPACDEPVDALVDAGALLLDELGGGGLLREIHALARHYHWSEGEILGLTRTRRRAYLELLVAEQEPEGVAL